MDARRTSAAIEIVDEGADPEELERLADGLRRELAELDVDRVSKATSGEAPPGTRGIELAAVGALLVQFANSTEILSKIVDVITSWRGGSQHATIKIVMDGDTLELTRASAEQQEQVIGAWITAHTDG